MGISVLGRNSNGNESCSCGYCAFCDPERVNPDPKKWEVLRTHETDHYTALLMKYPNCKNREGEKILVFEAKADDILKQKEIDPHFGDGDLIYPIARFQPNGEGWADAVAYAIKKEISHEVRSLEHRSWR